MTTKILGECRLRENRSRQTKYAHPGTLGPSLFLNQFNGLNEVDFRITTNNELVPFGFKSPLDIPLVLASLKDLVNNIHALADLPNRRKIRIKALVVSQVNKHLRRTGVRTCVSKCQEARLI